MSEFKRAKLREIFKDNDIEVPSDVITEICNLHTESNQDLKDELDSVTKERDELKKNPGGKDTVSKESYDKLKKDFDDYKSENEAEKSLSKKKAAAKKFVKGIGIDEEVLVDTIVDGFDYKNIELAEDGTIKDAENKLKTSLQSKWKGYIREDHVEGQKVPDTGKGAKKTGKMTKAEIGAIEDPDKRRAAIIDHLDDFD